MVLENSKVPKDKFVTIHKATLIAHYRISIIETFLNVNIKKQSGNVKQIGVSVKKKMIKYISAKATEQQHVTSYKYEYNYL